MLFRRRCLCKYNHKKKLRKKVIFFNCLADKTAVICHYVNYNNISIFFFNKSPKLRVLLRNVCVIYTKTQFPIWGLSRICVGIVTGSAS